MVDDNSQRTATRRRDFIKTTGAVSFIGASTFAGCLGGSPSSGGGGSGGNGSGGSGGNGSGGSGGSSSGGSGGGSNSQVNITLAPSGFQGIVMDHIVKDTNILQKHMQSEGYTPKVQESWEGAALFASGGPDFSTMSSLEAARLAGERNQQLAVNAKLAPQFMGWMYKIGSDYDPDNTGGTQASIDMIAKEGGKVGIGSWAGGHVPADSIALKEVYGRTFSEQGGDFAVTTADYFAIPTLINDGDLATGSTSPIHGAARFLTEEPKLDEFFWGADLLTENNIGVPQLNSWTCTQKFANNNPGAVKALVQAWHEGMTWFFKNPVEIVRGDSEHIEQLGVQNAKQAEYIVDWGINLNKDTDYPIVYKDIELTDEFIKKDRNFLNSAQELGYLPDNWSDRLEYRKVPQGGSSSGGSTSTMETTQ